MFTKRTALFSWANGISKPGKTTEPKVDTGTYPGSCGWWSHCVKPQFGWWLVSFLYYATPFKFCWFLPLKWVFPMTEKRVGILKFLCGFQTVDQCKWKADTFWNWKGVCGKSRIRRVKKCLGKDWHLKIPWLGEGWVTARLNCIWHTGKKSELNWS